MRAEGVKKPSHRPKALFTEGFAFLRRPKGVPEASRRPNVNANERDDLGVATGKDILRAARGCTGVIRRDNALFTG